MACCNKYFFLLDCCINPNAHHIEEATLIARLKDRDKQALAYLYDHYSAALYGVIHRILIKESIAEEVLQDVFIKIWDKIDSYDAAKGKLFTWMLNIARNQAIDKTRSREISKEKKTKDIDLHVNRIDRNDYTEQKIEGIGLHEVLKSLPEEQRFVVEHLYFKGYTQSELADESGIPLGTVKTRLRAAMQQLRILVGTA